MPTAKVVGWMNAVWMELMLCEMVVPTIKIVGYMAAGVRPQP